MKVTENLYLTIKYQFIDIESLVMIKASFWQPAIINGCRFQKELSVDTKVNGERFKEE